jgi:hypothetical protein
MKKRWRENNKEKIKRYNIKYRKKRNNPNYGKSIPYGSIAELK